MNISLATNKADDMYDNVSVLRKSMQSVIENVTGIESVTYSSTNDFYNDTMSSSSNFTFEHKEYIFDRKEVRIIFITLYSLVFCCCFFGEYVNKWKWNPNQSASCFGHESLQRCVKEKQNQIKSSFVYASDHLKRK